jgi:DNA invertase Pin-like site-specific DNA recombinase
MRVAIYARVSRTSQELEHQIASCQRFCDYKKYDVGAIYSEKLSGKNKKRPEYQKLLSELRQYKFDAVVVFRLDRLGRNARELALDIEELENKGIKIFSVSENFDTSTAFGRAMREMVFIFAQLEREQIGEATSQRLHALKDAGKKLGRKIASPAQIARVQGLAGDGLSVRVIARSSHISKSTVANIVQQKGAYSFLSKNTQKEACPINGNKRTDKTRQKRPCSA